MDAPQPESGSAQAALAALSVLNKLILEAGLSRSRQELVFRILNRTIELSRYHRACLFDLGGKKPKLLGVSGQSEISADSELAAAWTGLVADMPAPQTARILTPEDFPKPSAAVFADLATRTDGLSVVWLPLVLDDRCLAGVWLERWNGEIWREFELGVLSPLGVGYTIAWDKSGRWAINPAQLAKRLCAKRSLRIILAGLALVLCLRISLRVVAPCEVMPEHPFVVAAPLNGVIEEVFVKPGQPVEKGAKLFAYDKRVAAEDLKIAQQQVQIMQSMLNRSNMQAFLDPKARSEASLLELKLEQEKTRLELAEQNQAKLEAVAEVDGLAILDDPNEWRGRPVSVGEKILSLVHPAQTKLRIYLPIDDNVPFDDQKPVTVFLNASPESELRAKLRYVAQNVSVSPHGVPCVLAEADWVSDKSPPRIGLQGSAVVYGRSVSLAYWLLRKPLAWARRTLGV